MLIFMMLGPEIALQSYFFKKMTEMMKQLSKWLLDFFVDQLIN